MKWFRDNSLIVNPGESQAKKDFNTLSLWRIWRSLIVVLRFISKKQYKQNNVICKTIQINDDIKRNFDSYMSKLWEGGGVVGRGGVLKSLGEVKQINFTLGVWFNISNTVYKTWFTLRKLNFELELRSTEKATIRGQIVLLSRKRKLQSTEISSLTVQQACPTLERRPPISAEP